MNPLANNPLRTRDDFAKAVVQIWAPLKPYFSDGKANVYLSKTGTHCAPEAAGLEGFSRPLFGLASLAAGGGSFADWDLFRQGYATGTDPEHPEFWGNPGVYDQRQVEAAAISFGLLFAKDKLWDTQTPQVQANIGAWLKSCLSQSIPENNWRFFHVMDSLALEHLGIDHDTTVREQALTLLETYYVDKGWYSDGGGRRFDHYVPFAMHMYGLLYTKFAVGDEARCDRFRTRAAEFALEFQHWFDANGACIPYGRSMTYRFAMGAFWAALAVADVEALPWGEMRGLWARNMRWWGDKDFYDRDGVLSVGYLYPNLLVSENYASPCSPYWANKAFLPLALGADHPFWTTPEIEKQKPQQQYASPTTGVIGFGDADDRILLSSCGEMRRSHKGGADKYGKFAYSSKFGFSVDHDSDAFFANPFENMLAFSQDGRTFSVRRDIDAALIGDDWLYSKWSPERGISVETWLFARDPWHLRCHKITSKFACLASEGGFGIERLADEPEAETAASQRAEVRANGSFSFAIDGSDHPREGVNRRAMPNSSLMYSRSFVPHLTTRLPVGETWLKGAFCAGGEGKKYDLARAYALKFPSNEALETLKTTGKPIAGMSLREPEPLDMNKALLDRIGFNRA